MNLYRSLLRPILFRLDAETAHHFAINVCAVPGIHRLADAIFGGPVSTAGGIDDPRLRVQIGELNFPNPVGLAAGWDKNAQCMRCLESLGFGAIEVGSVSAKASIGNPKPRLFRLPKDDAIVVNYGLPNDGAEVIARRLARHRPRVPLGVNVVKTNDVHSPPATDAIYDDYFDSISRLHRYAGYLVLNLSCPNSEGDADFFASPGSASPLLDRLAELDLRMPVFLKVAPDPEPRSIERWIEEAQSHSFVTGFVFNLPSGKPETLRMQRCGFGIREIARCGRGTTRYRVTGTLSERNVSPHAT